MCALPCPVPPCGSSGPQASILKSTRPRTEDIFRSVATDIVVAEVETLLVLLTLLLLAVSVGFSFLFFLPHLLAQHEAVKVLSIFG